MSYIKDPESRVTVEWDWSAWLGEETIEGTPVVLVDPADGVEIDGAVTAAAGVVSVWVTGGTLGETVALTNRVTSSGGRIEDWTVYLKIREK